MYAVIQPYSQDVGAVLSRHRTVEAAQRQIDREDRAFRRRYPRDTQSWLDREIAECERGATTARRAPLWQRQEWKEG